MKRTERLKEKQQAVRRVRAVRHAVAYAVIGTLAVTAGAVLLTAPGLSEIARTLPGKRKSPNAVAKIISGLCKRGFVSISGTQGARMAQLTDLGKKRAYFEQLHPKVPSKKVWDGLWFMVSFDIPATEKRARDSLRQKLRDIGFVSYQKSLYVFPAGCESEIDFIVEYYGVGKWLKRFYAADLQDDGKFKKHFNLC